MPKSSGPHLIKPGSSAWVAGQRVLGTWCGQPSSRDDVNDHAINAVKCPCCLRAYWRDRKNNR